VAYYLGDTYTRRLSNHRGYQLVTVADRVEPPLPARPRHTIFVLVDGLRRDAALGMKATARLAAAGRCTRSDVGSLSVSRPVWTTLSTGVEQDRTGVRNNDDDSPLAVESIWDLARAAGMVVSGISELDWWRVLFPGGFSEYTVAPPEDDHFARLALTDLNLIHPVYVDETAHDHGAASPEYRADVARVDAEITRFLDRVDLSRDLVILTADHGHSATGGHGGRAPEIAMVETCLAGPGIAPSTEETALPSIDLGPALAILLGLPFPRNMRAGDDALDAIFPLLDPAAFPAGYLDARRAGIARFRAANPDWRQVYADARGRQHLRLGILLAAILAAVIVARRGQAPGALLWIAFVAGVTAALHILFLHGLDFTALNKRGQFIQGASGVCILGAALGAALHGAIWRDLSRLISDQAILIVAALLFTAGYLWVYGSPIGFPLPGPILLFLPFLTPIFVLWHCVLLLLLLVSARIRSARRSSRAT
jgi:hypothetical protein